MRQILGFNFEWTEIQLPQGRDFDIATCSWGGDFDTPNGSNVKMERWDNSLVCTLRTHTHSVWLLWILCWAGLYNQCKLSACDLSSAHTHHSVPASQRGCLSVLLLTMQYYVSGWSSSNVLYWNLVNMHARLTLLADTPYNYNRHGPADWHTFPVITISQSQASNLTTTFHSCLLPKLSIHD